MKITPAHLTKLETLISEVVERNGPEKLADHYQQVVLGDPRTKDPYQRYRWDLFHATHPATRYALVEELYRYLNDTHIDTALRSIVKDPAK